jgi:hypothetical protein
MHQKSPRPLFAKKNLSKLRAQKWPKIVDPAPLASNTAGSSVALSNGNGGGDLYLSDSEVSQKCDSSQVSA